MDIKSNIKLNIKYEDWSRTEIEEACSFTALTDRIYDRIQSNQPQFSFSKCVHSIEDFDRWSNEFRNEILKLLGIQDMMNERGNVVVVKDPEQSNPNPYPKSYPIDTIDKKMKRKYPVRKYTMEHFYIKSWMDTLIPVLLCKPEEPIIPMPAFVCTHGHGQNKAQLVALEDNRRYPHSVWAHDLANMGIMTITMDQWGWNERGGYRCDGSKIRIDKNTKNHRLKNYDSKEGKFALNMLQFGRTINGLRFFDVIRQVDYLLTRNDVDPNRIGIGGLSLGGTTAGWTMSIDPRINLGVVAGYMNTFKDSIIDLAHCSCNYIPGISNLGEMYDVFSLMAPRPVCFITGKHDSIYPLESAQKAFFEIKKAYGLFNADEKCILDITPLGHGWRGDIAYNFIKKQWNLLI